MVREKQTFVPRVETATSSNAVQHEPEPIRKRQNERQNETTEQTAKRRLLNSQRTAISRQIETAEQRAVRNERKRANRANAMARRLQTTARMAVVDEIDETNVDLHYIGALNQECVFCQAKYFLKEKTTAGKFNVCCNGGQVRLSGFETNDEIKDLMTGKDPDSKHFMENIRSYNCAFAFASVGANIKVPPGYGPYCFRIHGQICHLTGTLHPLDEADPRSYAQLYILDPDEANNQRMNEPANKACKGHMMAKLSEIMKNNKFVEAYEMLHEVEKRHIEMAREDGSEIINVAMDIKQKRGSDNRRYNVQACNEVAVVFKNVDGEPPLDRDLRIYLRPQGQNGQRTQKLWILNKNLDALTYPLLYPAGEQGWGEDLALFKPNNANANARKRVTLKMYYSYIFSVRDAFSPMLSAGKLTQQYFVDAYVKAEANDLNWIKQNQSTIRAETYENLVNHIGSVDEAEGLDPGKQIILPSSFQGSARNMAQNYHDAMAIVRKFGKPDLFITMTCNPKWKEISENLRENEKPENRPDLVTRVFNLKLNELMDDLTKKHVLGHVIAKVHVIEFQKRGLPHAHMLIILKSEDKPNTIALIDKIVSAEIPNKETHPRLFGVVVKNMIHGPCNRPNSRSPCLHAGICQKGFPKPFQNETVANCNGYPLYRRRQTELVKINNVEIDNSWVVPYSPHLSLKYNCHINVEVCASVRSVKYLFKYAYKGHDCANIELTTNKSNELKKHVDSRYVSPPEAAWRIFRFLMHDQSHSICRLMVHLPDQQSVTFDAAKIGDAIAKAENRDSTLIAWFKLNQVDPDARQYKYYEIPEHYVFNKETCNWTKRKQGFGKVIGRMHGVSFRDSERYFLRLLLLHVTGATDFDDVMNYEGNTYHTFYGAAKARGLVEDEQVWDDTLTDAACASMPKQLREMFAFICVNCKLPDASSLWNKHKANLVEDFAWRHGHPPTEDCETCESFALRDVSDTLTNNGKQCSDYNLRNPPEDLPLNLDDFVDIDAERDVGEELLSTLNIEQQEAFDAVLNAIRSNAREMKAFFLDGPGGSGKTHLYKTILSYIRGQGDIALPVASTGIAANLLKGGRTAHSQYLIPLELDETSVSGVRMTSNDAKLIRKSKILIWDESTMAPAHALHCVDRLLREIMKTDVPFGGKVLLLGGDFRQTLPIILHAEGVAIVQASIKFSHLWRRFKILKLNNNVRSQDTQYSDWLIKLGNGELSNDEGLDEDMIEIPESMLASDNIVKDIFGDSLTPEGVESFSKMAILCPTNADVDKINEQVLNILQGESKTYLSCDKLVPEEGKDIEEDRSDYQIEFLNSLSPSGLPPHQLKIKIGAIVMLLRNLNTKRGLCNGTRLIVTDMKPNLIIAKVLTGSAAGQIVFIPRIDMTTNSELPFKMTRRQFPIKLAFAMTINKSQGQTLDKVGLYLQTPVFSHGQLYVGFSRVRRSCDVKVYVGNTIEHGKLIPGSNKVFTRNVVYKDILTM